MNLGLKNSHQVFAGYIFMKMAVYRQMLCVLMGISACLKKNVRGIKHEFVVASRFLAKQSRKPDKNGLLRQKAARNDELILMIPYLNIFFCFFTEFSTFL